MPMPAPKDWTKVLEAALAIMESEDMLWLMSGGDPSWTESHLKALRPAWKAYIEAGGRTWGQ